MQCRGGPRGKKKLFYFLQYMSTDSLAFQGFSSVSVNLVFSSKVMIFLSRAHVVITGCYGIVICLSPLKAKILHSNNLLLRLVHTTAWLLIHLAVLHYHNLFLYSVAQQQRKQIQRYHNMHYKINQTTPLGFICRILLLLAELAVYPFPNLS